MKFGYIDFNLTVESYWSSAWNGKALLNIGDAAEYMVIKQIYNSIGIAPDEMHGLSIRQLETYRGEKLIVALNLALDSYVGYNAILENLSPDIIPVFLGMCFTDTNLKESHINCLRKYAPVGCRDERSYLLMKEHGIPAYLNGCMAAVLEHPSVCNLNWKDKIVFIDVPYGVLQYISESIKKDVVFLSQEKYCRKNEFGEAIDPSAWAENILRVYSSRPRMIVTSRFHGAVLAMANDIPAVITLEKYTFRFSWLQNYFPIYTEKNFNQIPLADDPCKVSFEDTRALMKSIAQTRILETIFAYRDMDRITKLQKSKQGEDEAQVSNQVLYYRRVWEEIQKKWSPEKEYKYGFWGVNDNAEKLFSLISERYPKAKLVGIYDMFKDVSFRNIPSKKPAELSEYKSEENFFVIVTAYLASRVAEDIFIQCDFPDERAFLCTRDFITEEDLKKQV